MCAILDIPVYSSLTESLHVLFTLYSDFKANVHFQQQVDGMPPAGSAADADVWGPM
jgi:intraflagellar transport protein 46